MVQLVTPTQLLGAHVPGKLRFEVARARSRCQKRGVDHFGQRGDLFGAKWVLVKLYFHFALVSMAPATIGFNDRVGWCGKSFRPVGLDDTKISCGQMKRSLVVRSFLGCPRV